MELSRNTKRQQIAELYERYEAIVPYAEKDGEVWVSFADASIINSVRAMEGNHGTGMQTRNPDGSLASTGKTVHAINPEYFFANRVMKKGKKLYVVSGHEPIGFRCIQEQPSGHTFVKSIPCYVLVRDDEGKLYVDSLTNVDDKTFISDYTSSLNHSLMAEIMPLIVNFGTKQTELDSMPI